MNLPKLLAGALSGAIALTAGAAMATTGTSDAATSMDGISSAFQDFLGGSGGGLIIVLGIIIAAGTMLFRASWAVVGMTLGVAAIVGYGFDAATTFASVSAPIPTSLPQVVDLAMSLPAAI